MRRRHCPTGQRRPAALSHRAESDGGSSTRQRKEFDSLCAAGYISRSSRPPSGEVGLNISRRPAWNLGRRPAACYLGRLHAAGINSFIGPAHAVTRVAAGTAAAIAKF